MTDTPIINALERGRSLFTRNGQDERGEWFAVVVDFARVEDAKEYQAALAQAITDRRNEKNVEPDRSTETRTAELKLVFG